MSTGAESAGTETRLCFRCGSCAGVNRVAPGRLADGPVCGRCQSALDTSGKPVDLDDAGLARLIAACPVPVVVDFWAPWCGPCRRVGPVLEAIAKERAGRVIVAKVNTDEHSQTSNGLGIRGIPAFALYRGGALVSQQSGALPKPTLAAWVDGGLS